MRTIHSFFLLCTIAAGTSVAFCQTTIPVVEQSYTGDEFVQVVAVTPKDGYTAALTAYEDCSAGAAAISLTPITVPASNPVKVNLASSLNNNENVCVREQFSSKAKLAALPDLISQTVTTIDRAPGVLSPSDKSTAAFSRISLGIDVSASSSVDPGANFLLDGAFESPLSKNSTPFKAPFWLSGYVRLASIAQPGAVSGLSDVATYIKPLTAASPDKLVQSAEANIGFETTPYHPPVASQFVVISGIIDAGIITPLSISQADPTVYIVNQAIYNYYTTKPIPDPGAYSAITAPSACGTSFPTTPCYLAYIPQDRTRFFRNYAAGITLKKYYYNGGDNKADDSFGFPGYAVVTLGQNEYVSAGRLQGLILHVSASWPLPSTLSQKWGGSIYVYGGIDTNLRGKNKSDAQFLLQSAGSTITPTSANVALITLPQEDRDRYRFGVGVDVVKLVSILTSKTQ